MTAGRSERRGLNQAAASSRVIRIGISPCRLRETVRFDGGHTGDALLADTFGRVVEWVPICLEGQKDCPTCRLDFLAVSDCAGVVVSAARAVQAGVLVQRFPLLPVEDEGRLSDPRLRHHFVERVFAYWRLRSLFEHRWTIGALVRFHTVHKLMLMARAPEIYRQLGRLTAAAATSPRRELSRSYTESFMGAMAVVATRARHVNVLQHMLGYFRRRLDTASRAELIAAIDDYRRARVPLIVPLTLLRHHVRVHRIAYLDAQLYLNPDPNGLSGAPVTN